MPFLFENSYRDPNRQQSARLTAQGAAAAVDDLYRILVDMSKVRFSYHLPDDQLLAEARRLRDERARVNDIREAMRKYSVDPLDEAKPYIDIANTIENSIAASWREIRDRAQRIVMQEAGL